MKEIGENVNIFKLAGQRLAARIRAVPSGMKCTVLTMNLDLYNFLDSVFSAEQNITIVHSRHVAWLSPLKKQEVIDCLITQLTP
jgi:hypothetical protein